MNKRRISIIAAALAIVMNVSFNSAGMASKKPNVIFVHHSVGESLIRDGALRQILSEAGLEFWDHGYNDPQSGIRDGIGNPAGSYWIPEDNTDPDGLAGLFKLDPHGQNAFGRILNNHDVSIYKSCFPASQIQEDNIFKDFIDSGRSSLYNYKRHYMDIRDVVDEHPEKIFIFVTQPPLHPNATNKDEARRAMAFVKWLTSSEYLGERKNLFVFDYFSLLADERTGMLRTAYQIDPKGKNSHPNPYAQMLIAPQFADFIINSVRLGTHSSNTKVAFDNPEWPASLVRVTEPSVTLSGKVETSRGINKILWSDLNGQRGELSGNESWVIKDINLSTGVTTIIVTAVDEHGFRSSAAIGIQYYSGRSAEYVIFDDALMQGSLNGISYSDTSGYSGRRNLFIKGTGQPQRVSINGIQLDISDCDPEGTYLKLLYDQGFDKAKPRLFIIGVGDLYLNVDSKLGYEEIIIPFSNFKYVHNILDKLVLRNIWASNTNVHIDSINLICSGKELDGNSTSLQK